jgi:MFS family permease
VTDGARRVQRTYAVLTLLSTLASSLIWGINTLFLLDAGLSIGAAFIANAFYTVGQVVFEVPTGVVADTWGRKTSYLLGAATLMVSTLLYLVMWWVAAPLWGWMIASIVLGLGFTFFSGAVEAWLVDALAANGFDGDLDPVLARGQVTAGAAMLGGSVAGGYLAQLTNLGVPYLVRAGLLAITLGVAAWSMRDEGFVPSRGDGVTTEMKRLVRASIDYGWNVRPLRWVMLASPFTTGVFVYAFYAMQPYLLELYGDPAAFGIAGIAAAVVAGAQIVGGLTVKWVRRVFRSRTTVILVGTSASAAALALAGGVPRFWVAIGSLIVWGLVGAATGPVRQAYVNGLVPSRQRATILSFDALLGSAGGVVIQPGLGRVADVTGFAQSYLVAAVIQAGALPLIAASRSHRMACDRIGHAAPAPD